MPAMRGGERQASVPAREQMPVQAFPNDGEPVLSHRGTPMEQKVNDRSRGLFALADGSASRVGGEAAAASVAGTLARALGTALDRDVENISASKAEPARRRELLERRVLDGVRAAFADAQRRLVLANQAKDGPDFRAAAAVAKLADLAPGEKVLVHAGVGGHRLYVLHDGALRRVDETGREREDRLGEEGKPLRLDVGVTPVRPGDRVLLLSSSVADAFPEERLREWAARFPDARDTERALQDLADADAAAERGAQERSDMAAVVADVPGETRRERVPAREKNTGAPEHRADVARRVQEAERLLRQADEEHQLLLTRLVLAVEDRRSEFERLLAASADRRLARERDVLAARLDLADADVPPRYAAEDVVYSGGSHPERFVVRGYDAAAHAYRLERQSVGSRPPEMVTDSRYAFERARPDLMPVREGDRFRLRLPDGRSADAEVLSLHEDGGRALVAFDDRREWLPMSRVRAGVTEAVERSTLLYNELRKTERLLKKSARSLALDTRN